MDEKMMQELKNIESANNVSTETESEQEAVVVEESGEDTPETVADSTVEVSEDSKETPEEPLNEGGVDVEDEPTIGELFDGESATNQVVDKKTGETVDKATFLEIKKELTEMKNKLGLKKNDRFEIEAIQDIVEDYDVDEQFVSRLAAAIQTSTRKEIEQKYEKKINDLHSTSVESKKQQLFDQVYEKTLKLYPEYAGIANKKIIKTLALDSSNKGKKVSSILKETYGKLSQVKPKTVTSKKSATEKATPAAKPSGPIDWNDPDVQSRIATDKKLQDGFAKHLQENMSI